MHPPAPKLSIGLPVYNGERYLTVALRSLLDQDYTDFELIIADNASTDGTEQIARSFAASDDRIRYYRNPANIGLAPNFRLVFDYARGEFFKWAASDDMHYPGNLRTCMKMFAAAPPEVALVAPRFFLIDENGVSLMDKEGLPFAWTGYRENPPERLSTHAKTPHARLAEILPNLHWSAAQFGVFRRSALALTRKIDSFYASDRVLLAEVAMLGEIWEVDELLFARRQHAEISTTVAKTAGAYALLMNPKLTGRATKRRPIMSLEYLRSIRRLPLSPRERVLCGAVIMQVWARQKMDNLLLKKRVCADRRLSSPPMKNMPCL